MRFLYYDLLFLVIFSIAIAFFLYKNRKKLQIESKILLLYRTKWGMKLINRIGTKYPSLLNILVYCSIISGYVIMILAMYFIIQTLFLIINAVSLPNIPPLMPLIPYLPSIFKLDFLPPFYFTYWIITILIVAVSHEFSHGIFARFGKIRIKSTGFGFLGPFLAAFVETDEKQMAKKPIKTQLSVLSGGVFANLIVAILFILVLKIFFMAFYIPAGMNFNTYMLGPVNVSDISSIGGIGISNADFEKLSMAYDQLNLTNKSSELKIVTDEENYFLTADLLGMQLKNNQSLIIAYEDTPAYRNKIEGAIQGVIANGKEYSITNQNDLNDTLNQLSPGQNITIRTTTANYNITLASDANNQSRAYLGVGLLISKSRLAKIIKFFSPNRDDSTYYAPRYSGEYSKLIIFIYNLLFWLIVINLSVMLVNMLPFGIFDGGRFFYLTILGLTKSKRIAEKCFAIMNSIILLLLIAMMAVWFFRLF